MVTFLFWNLNGKDLSDSVCRLAVGHSVDVLMLVESGISPALLLQKLNTNGGNYHFLSAVSDEAKARFSVFSRFPSQVMPLIHDEPRMIIYRLSLPAANSLNIVLVHFRDKGNATNAHQTIQGVIYAQTILEKEENELYPRTVVIGDFNMNPFDWGIVGGGAFNAVMDSKIARRGTRVVERKRYKYFYNPMWTKFGDVNGRVPGTYFYDSGDHENYYWNIVDQVLIRPDLLDCFSHEDLAIITHDGTVSLLNENGRPNSCAASDHLPLMLTLSN